VSSRQPRTWAPLLERLVGIAGQRKQNRNISPHNDYPNPDKQQSMETERTSERDRPLRLILIVVASILIIPLVLMAVMMPMMWMVGGMETGGAVSMSPVWGIGMMLVFLLIVLGVGYALYRTLTQAGISSGDPAVEELRVAYARGELSQEEFEQRREALH